jgi:hypothetical protein
MTIRTVYITINNRPNLIAYPPFISSFGRVPFSSSYLILYSFLFSFVSSAVYVALSSLFFSVCVEWVDIYKNGGRMLLWSLLHDGRFGGSWGCCMAAVDYIQPGGGRYSQRSTFVPSLSTFHAQWAHSAAIIHTRQKSPSQCPLLTAFHSSGSLFADRLTFYLAASVLDCLQVVSRWVSDL